MVESGLGYGIANGRQADTHRNVMKVLSLGLKGLVVVFPLPLAFLSVAPPAIKIAALYMTFLTLALFVVLSEITGALHRVADALEKQHRSS